MDRGELKAAAAQIEVEKPGRERTGVMEIGLKSPCSLDADFLGTGMMAGGFHCCRVVEMAMDRLKRRGTDL